MTWQEIGAKKREENALKIPQAWRLPNSYTDKVSETANWNVLSVPRECGVLTEAEIQITESYDAIGLLGEIARGKFKAEEVATAFCKRAAIAQQLTNCLTETFFDEAIAHAKELDEYLAKEGKLKGPLHGLPISLKDSFSLQGVHSTIGYISFVGRPVCTFNSPLVELLLDLGAVLYVKTNIPQTMMSADSDNNVFGRVLNPCNISWGAGGSSGGEGALVKMRGSLIGVGTDIAGSIRIPALCCGTFGFKPTASRIPFAGGTFPGRAGSPSPIQPVAGPLTTSFRDLGFFLDCVIRAQPWNYDATALSIPWRRDIKPKKALTLGFISGDPAYPIHPPVTRTLANAASKLQQAGHTVKHLSKIPSISSAALLSFKYFSLDNTKTAFTQIEAGGEPLIPSLAGSGPTFAGHTFTLEELFDLNIEQRKFVTDWHAIWMKEGLDAVIGAGHGKTAGKHDTYGEPPYTVYWNLMDNPACVIPWGNADAKVDVADPGISDYDPKIVDGAPCSIQIAGRRFQDEELLSVVEVISSVLAE